MEMKRRKVSFSYSPTSGQHPATFDRSTKPFPLLPFFLFSALNILPEAAAWAWKKENTHCATFMLGI